MRKFIRHPSDIPIEFNMSNVVSQQKESLYNISGGGLSFSSNIFIESGSRINIRIPLRNPVFEEIGVVMWCRKNKDTFDVGVQFEDDATDFRLRMVEQVSYIEHYKKEVLATEGRILSGKEAATEWIMKYAKDFPR